MTMETVPGREISSVVGDVVGVVARTRELRPDLRGGHPMDGYVVMLTDSRQDAVARMVEMAQAAGRMRLWGSGLTAARSRNRSARSPRTARR